ncbi:hypothetical protein M404DRAFT_711603 [Pisolithus tinctorius Marx 270]|uniref:Uncharacterized protein n=1 Tax=Pisolithus tinctorius Marx 270 TaxID=870435 RepID=A0A0C3PV10_PISTI|nr:hypothetical protein M404DRAFT_711603 [Pisolithus tinctorius Marx 270]
MAILRRLDGTEFSFSGGSSCCCRMASVVKTTRLWREISVAVTRTSVSLEGTFSARSSRSRTAIPITIENVAKKISYRTRHKSEGYICDELCQWLHKLRKCIYPHEQDKKQ